MNAEHMIFVYTYIHTYIYIYIYSLCKRIPSMFMQQLSPAPMQALVSEGLAYSAPSYFSAKKTLSRQKNTPRVRTSVGSG